MENILTSLKYMARCTSGQVKPQLGLSLGVLASWVGALAAVLAVSQTAHADFCYGIAPGEYITRACAKYDPDACPTYQWKYVRYYNNNGVTCDEVDEWCCDYFCC